jgi:hypothetical protein
MLRVCRVEQGEMNAVEVSLLEQPEPADRSSTQKITVVQSGALLATTRNLTAGCVVEQQPNPC